MAKYFLPALSLLFVVAKLFGAIDWSWWLVFSPVFVQFGIAILALACLGVVVAVAIKVKNRKLNK